LFVVPGCAGLLLVAVVACQKIDLIVSLFFGSGHLMDFLSYLFTFSLGLGSMYRIFDFITITYNIKSPTIFINHPPHVEITHHI